MPEQIVEYYTVKPRVLDYLGLLGHHADITVRNVDGKIIRSGSGNVARVEDCANGVRIIFDYGREVTWEATDLQAGETISFSVTPYRPR